MMKVFIVLSISIALVAAGRNGNVEKRGAYVGGAFPAVAVAPAGPLVAKSAVAGPGLAYASPQYFAAGPQLAYAQAPNFAFAQAPFGYAAPAAIAQPAYAAPVAALAAAPAIGGHAYAAGPAIAAHHAYGAPAPAGPIAVNEQYKSAGPQTYAQQVPAAAIRNVETVGVTKTITPVVTKTTTYNTHSEPALSVGHVQGYSQSAHGPGKVAPVQYNTVYTQYLNPTVGVNGPVTYSGPAIGQAVAVQQGVAAIPAAPQPVALSYGAVASAPQFAYAAGPQLAYAAGPQLAYAPGPQLAYAAPQLAYSQFAPQFLAAAPVGVAAPPPAPPSSNYGPPTSNYGPPTNSAKGY